MSYQPAERPSGAPTNGMIVRDQRGFLIGAAIGSGIVALAAERGGADFLLAISAGRFRNMGAPSVACMLPIADARPLTEDFSTTEILPQCKIPVLLGVNVWGETCDVGEIAERVRALGFAGAVNFPSTMHQSHAFQQILSRANRGIEREVEVLRAVQDAGLTAMFYCATRTQARLAADAGIDMICLNLGWNVGGAIGHRKRASIEEAALDAREIGRLVKRINPATRFLLEGGPIVTADDLGQVARSAPIDGYVGGSTIERLPLETSVVDQIAAYRQASARQISLDAEGARLVQWGARFGFVGQAPAQIDYLRRLKAVAASASPVALVTEPGMDTTATLDALAQRPDASKGKAVLVLDVVGEDFRAVAGRRLFGHAGPGGQSDGALADRNLAMVVIHAPQALPPGTQRRLARTLAEGAFSASGTRRRRVVAPRVVLVCDHGTEGRTPPDGLTPELARAVEGWEVRLPPLRERIDDLPMILSELAASTAGAGGQPPVFSPAAIKQLSTYPWPGNERELHALLGALAGRRLSGPIQPADLGKLMGGDPPAPGDPRSERSRILDALWRNGFHRTRTAAALGISRKTLYNKMQKFGLGG